MRTKNFNLVFFSKTHENFLYKFLYLHKHRINKNDCRCTFILQARLQFQLCQHSTTYAYTGLKNLPLPIISAQQNMYLYSSFPLPILSPIA